MFSGHVFSILFYDFYFPIKTNYYYFLRATVHKNDLRIIAYLSKNNNNNNNLCFLLSREITQMKTKSNKVFIYNRTIYTYICTYVHTHTRVIYIIYLYQIHIIILYSRVFPCHPYNPTWLHIDIGIGFFFLLKRISAVMICVVAFYTSG